MFCFIFVEGDNPDCFTEFIVYKKNGKCNGNKQRKCFHHQSELKMWCVNTLHTTYFFRMVCQSQMLTECYRIGWHSYKCARIARNEFFMLFF